MKLKLAIVALMAASTFISCKKCSDEEPRAKITNKGTESVSVQIKTSGGNTENINNVSAGNSSEFRSYAPGTVTFTIAVNKKSFSQTVEMKNCFEYDVVIDGNNNIVSNPVDRNE
jgi:hypothetical protein